MKALGQFWPEVEEWAKRTAVPQSVTQQVFARSCQRVKFLGPSGDARIDELVDLAR